jgi:hypothetical protein
MKRNNYIIKYFFILVVMLTYKKYSYAQIQPIIGFQTTYSFNGFFIGPSLGALIKDKLLLKYSYTTRKEKSDYRFSPNSLTTWEDIYKNHFFSAGWIFTKPYKKIRMGTGLTLVYQYDESNLYENSVLKSNYLIQKGFPQIDSKFRPFPLLLPFFYLDLSLSKNLKLVFNSSIIINEIGIGYRFGKSPIKPIVEEKINKIDKKGKVIFH